MKLRRDFRLLVTADSRVSAQWILQLCFDFDESLENGFGRGLISVRTRQINVMKFHNLLFPELKNAVIFEIEDNLPLGLRLSVLIALSLLDLCRLASQVWDLLISDRVLQGLKLTFRASSTLKQVHQSFRPCWHPIPILAVGSWLDLVPQVAFGVDSAAVSITTHELLGECMD